MDIKKDAEARVFSFKDEEGKKRTAFLSTYEGKDKEDNAKYSSWPTRFVGSAYDKAAGLKDKDVILLSNAKIESTYNKDTEKTYINLVVFDFEMKEED